MTEAAAQLIALRHYRTKWLGQAWEDIAEAWQTEYDSVAAGTFTPLQITKNSGDGWSAESDKNFEQAIRLDALQLFRRDKDAAYAAEVFAPVNSDGPSVMYPIFGQGCFPH